MSELPDEVRKGMIRVAVLVGLPAVVVSTALFLQTNDPYIPVLVMVLASFGIFVEWYRRGYFDEDEWEEV